MVASAVVVARWSVAGCSVRGSAVVRSLCQVLPLSLLLSVAVGLDVVRWCWGRLSPRLGCCMVGRGACCRLLVVGCGAPSVAVAVVLRLCGRSSVVASSVALVGFNVAARSSWWYLFTIRAGGCRGRGRCCRCNGRTWCGCFRCGCYPWGLLPCGWSYLINLCGARLIRFPFRFPFSVFLEIRKKKIFG